MFDTVKGFSQVMKDAPIYSLWFNEVRMFSVKVNMAFSMVFPFQNPNFSGAKIWLLAGIDVNCLILCF